MGSTDNSVFESMSGSDVQRSLENFLINPTTVTTMEQHGYESSPTIPVTPPREILSSETRIKVPETTTTFKAFRDRPIYSHGYGSEEELASPVDNDDFSFESFESDNESLASNDNGSEHGQVSTAQQLCSRAQAVHVVSAGKAKVVSMPKLVDSPSTQSPASPVTHPPTQTTMSNLTRTYINENTLSPSPSSWLFDEQRPLSPTLLVRAERSEYAHTIRRRPNLSPLQLVPRSEFPQEISSVPKADVASRTVNSIDYDQRPADPPAPLRSPLGPPKRRVYRLPSAFSLRALSKTIKRHSGGSDGSPTDPSFRSPQSSQKVQLHTIPDVHVPSRTSSKPLPKMVPRGANERAPPIVLPPCPYDLGDRKSDEELPRPLRKDFPTTPLPLDVEHSFAVARSRRKSLPAYVSEQV